MAGLIWLWNQGAASAQGGKFTSLPGPLGLMGSVVSAGASNPWFFNTIVLRMRRN